MSNLEHWLQTFTATPPRTVPKDVRYALLHSSSSWRLGMILASVACVVGFVVLFPWELASTLRLDLNSQLGKGQVSQSVFLKKAAGTELSKRRQRVFSVQFDFTDHFGYAQSGHCLTTTEFTPGTPVEVEYHPTDPALARVVGGFFVPGSYWAGIWALTFPALLLFGAWNYQRWGRRRRELLVHGQLAAAVIQQVWTDGSPANDNGWIALQFEVTGTQIQATESVSGAALIEARRLAKTKQPLALLHNVKAPREYIVLNLLPDAY